MPSASVFCRSPEEIRTITTFCWNDSSCGAMVASPTEDHRETDMTAAAPSNTLSASTCAAVAGAGGRVTLAVVASLAALTLVSLALIRLLGIA